VWGGGGSCRNKTLLSFDPSKDNNRIIRIKIVGNLMEHYNVQNDKFLITVCNKTSITGFGFG
jgi:hypothetical protein